MFFVQWSALKQRVLVIWQRGQEEIKRWTKPMTQTVVVGAITDVALSKTRSRAGKCPIAAAANRAGSPSKTSNFQIDRRLMVLLASKLAHWRQALLIVQPETVLRWHRELFKHFWTQKSKHKGGNHVLSDEVIALIKRMATENRLWGAERVQGELRKLGWRVGKGTVLKYLHQVRPPRLPSLAWQTFLHNQADDIWACDFIQVADVWFRSLFAFVIVELGSRRVVHVGVTRHPTDEWVAQQLREATPFGQGPKHLIRDNDQKYGPNFAAVAAGAQIDVIKTPLRAPRANAVCERFIGSVRRECLNHLLVRDERHLLRMLKAYILYFNTCRSHQGPGQRLPQPHLEEATLPQTGPIVSRSILGGLHHHYYRAAA